ncbi:MAG: diacylglycerol kinase family protein [Candidatus Moraniibacteriota bacterium]
MQEIFKSFRNAFSGIFFTFRQERNFQIESLLGIAALLGAWYFDFSRLELGLVVIMTALVLALELFNTAIERTMDILKPTVHPYVKAVKDIVAGAVLIVALAAIALGILLYAPHLFT